jgi:hypothetical protein
LIDTIARRSVRVAAGVLELRQEFSYPRVAGGQDIDLPTATEESGDVAGDESERLLGDAVTGGCRRVVGSRSDVGRGLVYRRQSRLGRGRRGPGIG